MQQAHGGREQRVDQAGQHRGHNVDHLADGVRKDAFVFLHQRAQFRDAFYQGAGHGLAYGLDVVRLEAVRKGLGYGVHHSGGFLRHGLCSRQQFALDGTFCAFHGVFQVVISDAVNLAQRVHGVEGRALNAAQDVQHLRAEVFVLGTEQGDRDLALLERVFDLLQGGHHLAKCLLCGRAARCKVLRQLFGVQAQRLEGIVCRVAAVDRADGEFLDGVAYLVDGENAGVCTVYKGLHELVGSQAQFGIFRRVLAEYVQQVAVLVRALLRAYCNQVVRLFAADAELIHQGGSCAAGFCKLKAKRIPQQVAAFGGLFQRVTNQAGVGLCSGQGFVDFADVFAEVISPDFVGNGTHSGQFRACRAGHGRQLVIGFREVGAHLGDFLAALQGSCTQGCDSAGSSGKARFQRAGGDVGSAGHGVAQSVGFAFGVVGSFAGFVCRFAGFLHGVGHAVGRCVGAAGSVFQLGQFRFGLCDVCSRAVHGSLGFIQGNGQVVQLFGAGFAAFLRKFQLGGHHFDLFSLGSVDRGQLLVLIAQRLHAAFLALKCCLRCRQPGF